jgi:hypothetical protein
LPIDASFEDFDQVVHGFAKIAAGNCGFVVDGGWSEGSGCGKWKKGGLRAHVDGGIYLYVFGLVGKLAMR